MRESFLWQAHKTTPCLFLVMTSDPVWKTTGPSLLLVTSCFCSRNTQSTFPLELLFYSRQLYLLVHLSLLASFTLCNKKLLLQINRSVITSPFHWILNSVIADRKSGKNILEKHKNCPVFCTIRVEITLFVVAPSLWPFSDNILKINERFKSRFRRRT